MRKEEGEGRGGRGGEEEGGRGTGENREDGGVLWNAQWHCSNVQH